MRRQLPFAVLAFAAAALVLAPEALAHGIVGREDLPIPRWLFGWAATAVLVLSFVALAVLWPSPRLEEERARPVLRVPRGLEVVCGLVGIALFAFVVWAGLTGAQSTTANIAPTFVWVLVWVGVPVLCLVLGDVFRPFNPWRAVGRAFGWAAGRVRPGALPEPLPYPERFGHWPAVIGLVAIAWVELVMPEADRNDPSILAVLMLVYAAVQLIGMSLYGVDAWTRRGDTLSVYFGLFARMAPLDWSDRSLRLRKPFSGLAELRAVPGTIALLATAIGITTFDGLSENSLWTDIALDLQEAFQSAFGLSASAAVQVAYTIGLLAVIGLVAGLYRLWTIGMHSVDPRFSVGDLGRRFVHSLVPIAFAYVLAHYFSLLVYQGQATAYLASDPRGTGADWLGTASATIDYGVVSANGVWYVQVGALVIGHVAGLVLAHDRALVVFDDVKRATRSQYWMLAVMVAFTSLGLWLLSAGNA